MILENTHYNYWLTKKSEVSDNFSIAPPTGSRSVAVITFASHAKGPQFDPGREQLFRTILPKGSLCDMIQR